METAGEWGEPPASAPPSWPPPPPPPAIAPPPPPPPRPERTAADVLRIIGAVIVVVASLAFKIWYRHTYPLGADRDPEPAPIGEIAPTHPFADTVSPRRLPPGTCLDRAPVTFVRAVPCDQGHIAEIVAVFRVESPSGGAYPPILELYRQSQPRCRAEYEAFTGATPDLTPASPSVAPPASYEWDGGERLVVCYASARNGGNLTGSLRAAPL